MEDKATTDPQNAEIPTGDGTTPPIPAVPPASDAPVSPPEAENQGQGEPPGQPSVPTGAPPEAPLDEGHSPPEPDPRDARIAELEAEIAGRKTASAALHADISALKTAHDQAQAQAAAKYRALALAGNPEIPEELVAGGTIDQVEASLTQAKAVVQKVREQIAAQAAAVITPGAPQRGAPDTESLSPIDKIKYAVTHRNNRRP